MNWEVRTMRSVTSCFNSTLYRKNLSRFWPIWALYSVIWLFAAKFISETNFGLANVSFTEQGIICRTGGADSVEYRLNWDDAVCCGRIKTRGAWWCYVSDHELSEKEKKEFPEFVEKGVFYFSDADNTVEELKKFLPPQFSEAL